MKYDSIRGRGLNYFFIVAGLTGLLALSESDGCQSYSKNKEYNKKDLEKINLNYNPLEEIIVERK